MGFFLIGEPPPLRTCGQSWRELYVSGCLFQRELVSESELSAEARKRGFALSQVGSDKFEESDRLGSLCPIGFAAHAYISGGSAPAIPVDAMVFRDERDNFEPWDTYAWDAWGYPHVSALYTPWQMLALPDVIEGTTVAAPLEMLVGEDQIEWGEAPKACFTAKYAQWTHPHEAWDPTLRLLVRFQNRY